MDKELMLLDQIEEIRLKAIEEPQNYPIDNTIRLITAKVRLNIWDLKTVTNGQVN